MKPVEGEELLHELGRLAREEARRVDSGTDLRNRPHSTQQLLSAVLREQRTSSGQRTWLQRLKGLFRPGISASLAVCCTAALIAWIARPTDASPRYELEIQKHVAAERGSAEPPQSLVAGAPVQVLLRPATQTELTPRIAVAFLTGDDRQALPAAVELAPSGAVRVSATLPNQAGQLRIALSNDGSSKPQTWTLDVLRP